MSNRKAGNISVEHFFIPEDEDQRKLSSPWITTPPFQRNYAWDKSKIDNLFNSIRDNEQGYYIGNIVTIAGSDGAGSRDLLIDGQQRLVTLSLIFQAIYELTDSDPIKEKIRKLLFFGGFPRLEFSRIKLNDIYKIIIHGDFSTIDPDSLDDAEGIFYGNYVHIKNLSRGMSDLDIFFQKILFLEFVVIKCGDDNDAYQLFEGLNSTGLSLAPVEIIKNTIFGSIQRTNSDKLTEAMVLWEDMQNKFESDNAVWLDKFLRQQLFYSIGYIGTGIFEEFKKQKIKDKNADEILDYVKEINQDSSVYIAFRKSELFKSYFSETMAENNWKIIEMKIKLIKELGLDQIYSVLLALYKYGKQESRYFERGESFVKHINKLWAFSLIVRYTKISPASYERKFANLCKRIKSLNYDDFKVHMNSFFTDELAPLIQSAKELFAKNLNLKFDYRRDSRVLCRVLIEEYLLYVGDGSDASSNCEHIIPENDQSCWIGIENLTETLKHLNKIGNLTLMDSSINESADFRVANFDTKYDLGYKENKSRFTVNNSLKDDWGDAFNSVRPEETAIIPRGKIMSECLYDKYYNQLISN